MSPSEKICQALQKSHRTEAQHGAGGIALTSGDDALAAATSARAGGRNTIETIHEVRLKQFCARFNTWVEQAIHPGGAKTSRRNPPRQRLTFFSPAGECHEEFFAAYRQPPYPSEGGCSGARLRDAGRRHWLCRAPHRRLRHG